ncbi:MAG: hypothetical protein AAB371_00335 [Patescibacteria group bacterium]
MNPEAFSKEKPKEFFSKEEIQDALLFSMEKEDLVVENRMLSLLNNRMEWGGNKEIKFSDLSEQEIETIKRVLELKKEAE